MQDHIQPFTRALIERYLRRENLHFLTDKEGDFQVEFAPCDEWGCDLRVWLCAEGEAGDLLAIRVLSPKRIERAKWGRVAQACNEWNGAKRWPCAFLHIGDYAADQHATLLLERHIDLGCGTHQEFVDRFCASTLVGAFGFWTWAHGEKGI